MLTHTYTNTQHTQIYIYIYIYWSNSCMGENLFFTNHRWFRVYTIHRSTYTLSPILSSIFISKFINVANVLLAYWIGCLPMAREIKGQSLVKLYQRLLKKSYLIPPCLTLGIISYGSRVKWSNPGKGVASSPTPQCSS